MVNKKRTSTVNLFYCILAITCLLFSNCKTSGNSASHKKVFKQIYVDQFKLTYFRSLLLKSYNNSEDIKNIINLDKSGFTEPILTIADYRLIDSLTTADNIQLTVDSTTSIGRVAEGAEGKHILGYVLKKLESKRLDSVARKRYKYAKVDEQYPEY